MIRIPHATLNGETYVAKSAVASITSAGWSSNYSLRSIVRLHNGQGGCSTPTWDRSTVSNMRRIVVA